MQIQNKVSWAIEPRGAARPIHNMEMHCLKMTRAAARGYAAKKNLARTEAIASA